MLPYVVTFLITAVLTGGWSWAAARWTDLRFPIADLVITVCLGSVLALLPSVGWLLATVVMWLILRGAERAELWPQILTIAGGSAFIWLTAYVTLLGLTA